MSPTFSFKLVAKQKWLPFEWQLPGGGTHVDACLWYDEIAGVLRMTSGIWCVDRLVKGDSRSISLISALRQLDGPPKTTLWLAGEMALAYEWYASEEFTPRSRIPFREPERYQIDPGRFAPTPAPPRQLVNPLPRRLILDD